ncbi:MAG: energy transducer TonB [Nitrospirota bacterium]
MLDIKQNIIISLILHTTLIIVSFSINFRERVYSLPEGYILVSVIKEFSGDRLFTSEDNTEKHHYNQEILLLQLKITENNKDKIAEPASVQSDGFGRNDLTMTDEGSLKGSQTENITSEYKEENIPLESPHTPLWKKGGVGDFKNTSSQIIVKGQPEDEILDRVEKGSRKDTSSFYDFVRAAIERIKSYPLLARKRGMEGTVLVSFRIDGKGLPQDVTIVKSSGYQILDEEVPKMLRKASPFPELKGEIVIPVTFRLTESFSDR